MSTFVRGAAAAALLLNLAACADLGAFGHAPVGASGDAVRTPLAHSFAVEHPGAEPSSIVAPMQMPDLAAGDARVIRGAVSWYGPRFAGRPTANGERFDPSKLTMAHRQLPFGTRVRVTNPANGASVVVRVNDRGPFVGDRVADLSHAAAQKIGMVKAGVIPAELEVLEAESAGDASRARASDPRAASGTFAQSVSDAP